MPICDYEIDDRHKLRRIHRTLLLFQGLHFEMPLQQQMALIWVALNPGGTQRELARDLGVSTSSISRVIAQLSDVGLKYRKGYNLVSLDIDPNDRRIRRLHLTPKGDTFFRRVLSEFE